LPRAGQAAVNARGYNRDHIGYNGDFEQKPITLIKIPRFSHLLRLID
jgi:hypothetical protein